MLPYKLFAVSPVCGYNFSARRIIKKKSLFMMIFQHRIEHISLTFFLGRGI